MDDLLEQVLAKLKAIMQEADEISIYVKNNDRQGVCLKTEKIKRNANDIKKIFSKLKNS